MASNTNYYEFKDAKVAIANALRNLDWKIYGWKDDESDCMTDYFSPANWDGIAEKNGYVLVVDNSRNWYSEKEITKYTGKQNTVSKDIQSKIDKLNRITMECGASEQEEQTAKEKIELLTNKIEESGSQSYYTVIGHYPKYQANPSHSSWHIEKDGTIIAKGTGIAKWASLDRYDPNEKHETLEELTLSLLDYYSTEEEAKHRAEQIIEERKENDNFYKKFMQFINKLNAYAGSMLGEGETVYYENVTMTEYKTENKIVESEFGGLKDGQLFVLKTNFNYGRNNGYVYRIHEDDDGDFIAVKLNNKLTKECNGFAQESNHWYCITEDWLKWIRKDSIAWCTIEEVKTPYEVVKTVKRVVKSDSKKDNKTNNKTEHKEHVKTDTNKDNNPSQDQNNKKDTKIKYTIEESEHTKTHEKLWLIKITTKLERDEYVSVSKKINKIGGYYSKFMKAFIMKFEPSEQLKELFA